MRQQDALVPIQFVESRSSEAQRRFPQLPVDELAVVADTGEVWLGTRAWIVCLWALRGYRDLAWLRGDALQHAVALAVGDGLADPAELACGHGTLLYPSAAAPHQ